MDVLRRICAHHRVFLRREAIAVGYDDRAIARALKSGLLHRVRHGAYVFREEWDRLDASGRHLVVTAAVLRTAESEMVLSHTTAVAAHGLEVWGLDLERVHVTRTDGRSGRREAGVVQHGNRLEEGDVVRVHGVPVTSPTRTAVDLLSITGSEPGICVLDQMLAGGLTTRAELFAASARLTRTPGSLRTDLVISLADGRSESIGETRSRYMFWRQGLPAPLLQHEVRDGTGRVVARLDFAWPQFGVYVEFDGRVKYERLLRPGESVTDVVLREKRREELIGRLTGVAVPPPGLGRSLLAGGDLRHHPPGPARQRCMTGHIGRRPGSSCRPEALQRRASPGVPGSPGTPAARTVPPAPEPAASPGTPRARLCAMLNLMLLPLAATEGGAGATPYLIGGGALLILLAAMATLLAFGRGREHS